MNRGWVVVGLWLCACDAEPIRVVECVSDADCLERERCGPAQSCMPQNLISWDIDGLVVESSNAFDVKGGWYIYYDCSDVAQAVAAGTFECPPDSPTPNCCTAWDTRLSGPDGLPGWSIEAGVPGVSSGRACISATAAQVGLLPDGSPSYNLQWGVGLAVTLNDFAPFDATRDFEGGPISGLEFDLEGPSSRGRKVRVGLAVTDINQRYDEEFEVPTRGGRIFFDQLHQGEWVMPQVPLDRSRLNDLSVGVITVTDSTTPFDVCLTNIRVLQ